MKHRSDVHAAPTQSLALSAVPPQPASPRAVPSQRVSARDAVSAGVPTGITPIGGSSEVAGASGASGRQRVPGGLSGSAAVSPQSLRLAGMAAFFGLQRRRRAQAEAEVPHDDPYAAYLRWSGRESDPKSDRHNPAA
ncbi:hypothetical protein [Leucobacter sp. USHLN153]|uniref:hypothetical protein n=1 Tax=Leucobacter sp. USHLN153 TaxID=3081268 RepID=UPI00301A4ADA